MFLLLQRQLHFLILDNKKVARILQINSNAVLHPILILFRAMHTSFSMKLYRGAPFSPHRLLCIQKVLLVLSEMLVFSHCTTKRKNSLTELSA